MKTILPNFQLRSLGFNQCKLCDYLISEFDHANGMMNHLHDVHSIKRLDGSFEKYVYDHFDTPKCSCGSCGLKVKLHSRRLEFKMFADTCPNQQRFRNVSCPEYYLFRSCSVEETILLISNRQSFIGTKANTAEHLEKLSMINAGSSNPSSIESLITRTKKCENDIRKDLSHQNSGINNGFHGKKHSKETLIKIAKTRSGQANKISSPELIIWGMLHALDIQFEYQVPFNRYVIDFVLKNGAAIEVYGDYWHGPKMSMSKRKRDVKKEECISNEFELILFKESEIVLYPDKIVKLLCELKE